MSRLFNDAASDKLVYAGAVRSSLPMTLSAWAYPDDLAGNKEVVTVCRGSVATHRCSLRIVDANDRWQAIHYDGTTFGISEATSVSVNTWTHGAAVFTSNSSRLAYKDGVAGSTDTTASGTPTLDQTAIGVLATATPSSYMSGRIAEVGIWSVALTAAEIAALAKGFSPLLIRPASLVAYWPLIGRYDPEIDPKGGFNMTVTGTAVANHPRIIYPKRRFIQSIQGAAAAGLGITIASYHYRHHIRAAV